MGQKSEFFKLNKIDFFRSNEFKKFIGFLGYFSCFKFAFGLCFGLVHR